MTTGSTVVCIYFPSIGAWRCYFRNRLLNRNLDLKIERNGLLWPIEIRPVSSSIPKRGNAVYTTDIDSKTTMCRDRVSVRVRVRIMVFVRIQVRFKVNIDQEGG